jgi:hypothetical protein
MKIRWISCLLVLGVFSFLLPSRRGAAAPIISEFMASNASTLRDQDAEFSDWIEIYNDGETPVNLAGWTLTDDVQLPAKWTFPEVQLPARGFLVVFASEKDRRNPAAELHTNFRLENRGEPLVLLSPGAVTASGFLPEYPFQVRDSSYGITQDSLTARLVASGSDARLLVPTDGSLGTTWTAAEFDDSAWQSAPLPVGFDRKRTPTFDTEIRTDIETQMHSISAVAYLRQAFTVAPGQRIDSLVLRVRYDDGFVVFLNGVEVARRNAAAGSPTFESRATAAHPDAAVLIFEDFNITPAAGALREGTNVLAVAALNSLASNSDFFFDVEVVGSTVTGLRPNERVYFADPTPGRVNGPGVAALADPPEFSVLSGSYFGEVSVVLSSAEPDAVIRYTLDRTDPSPTSTVYTEPIVLATAAELRAKTFSPGLLPSRVAAEYYMVIDRAQENFSSDLPLVVVNTYNGRGVTDADYVSALAAFFEPSPGGRTTLTGMPSYLGNAGIKLRGSSSLGFEKKNYNLEIRDENDEDFDVSLLGMPAESDWVLHGPFSDKSLMRNALSYEWSNRVDRYAVRTRFVEMYLNTQSTARLGASAQHYIGVYVFMEKIKRGEHRVNVSRIPPEATAEPEVTGGYIFKVDRLDPGDSGFRTARNMQVAYVYPKERDTPAAQRTWIRNFFNQFEAALFSPNFADPELGYRRFIDVDSWIDHHILVELTKNIDGYRLSTFMFKEREGKLNMGPIWDYNLSLGNANYLNGGSPEGWYYPQLSAGGCNGFPCDYPWWPRLFQDPTFVQRYQERWVAMRQSQLRARDLLGSVQADVVEINEAQARNFQRWRVLGRYDWPNFHIPVTWQDEIDWMSGWISARIEWFDRTIVAAPTFSHAGGEVPEGFELTITAPAGTNAEIYYTLDGSDPRATNGDPSPTVAVYQGPITITQNVRVVARARFGGEIWSQSQNALFVTEVLPLAVTELMYNPPPPPQGSPYNATSFEFLELQNVGSETIALDGVRFSRGVTFEFAEGAVRSLGPGEHVVVVSDPAAFATRYDASRMRVAGEYSGSLSDSGEAVVLLDALGVTIAQFTYRDTWHPSTDGMGHSLVAADPAQPRAAFDSAEGWRHSLNAGGSPGLPDSETEPPGRQMPGDATQDQRLNVSDAVTILGHIVRGVPRDLPCGDGTVGDASNRLLLDVNADGAINLSDPVHILHYLFLGEPSSRLGMGCVPIAGCPEACRS